MASEGSADDQGLLATLQTAASELGLIGPSIAAAAPPPGAADALGRWLADGMHGDMGYMDRPGAERANPRAWATWARSVALLADRYDAPPCSIEPSVAGISRYARGDDYHSVLKPKLEKLCALLRRNGRQALPFVDTSPLMEKALAAAGGLGWIGKNGNLLRRHEGSFFFLGGLVTDAGWRPTPAVAEECGACTACIPACPTGAIVAPGTIDARRCISYLTIELKGPIPSQLRPLLGNRIFGCDDCQDVCPINDLADRPRQDPAYATRPGLDGPRLLELADLQEEEFFTRFRNSPVRRARWRGFLRNVMVALGNWGAPAARPGLERGLVHPDPLVRMHAAWGLGRVADGLARRRLVAQRHVEPDPEVREEIGRALAGLEA